MELKARGWGRNMGPRVIADINLSEMMASRDPNKGIYYNQPGLFRIYGEVSVAWSQTLRFTGDYRMQLDLSTADIVKLFKTALGSQLDVDLLDEHDFTVSDELKKRLLGSIKLSDLTIGDLAGLAAPAEKQEKPEDPPAQVRPFPRRI